MNLLNHQQKFHSYLEAISENPNPARSFIDVYIPDAMRAEPIRATIISVQGKVIDSMNLDDISGRAFRYEIQYLNSGVYILQITRGEQTFNLRFIKE